VGANVNITQSTGSYAETTIAINPTNPQNLFEADNLSGTCMYSLDGGATWLPSQVQPPARNLGDPHAAFDSFGNLFLTSVGSANRSPIYVAWSFDGGVTFPSSQRTSIADSTGGDQPSIAVGPGGSTAPGSVWVTYANGNYQSRVVDIWVTNGGSGYSSTSPPTVTISGDGSGAAATAHVTNGQVTSITIDNGGSGYGSNPTVTLSGGGGSGATATAEIAEVEAAGAPVYGPGNVGTFSPAEGVPGLGYEGGLGSVAVGPDGQVLVNYQNSDGPNNNTGPDNIWVGLDPDGLGSAAFNKVTVTNVSVTAGGSGYTSAPAVLFNNAGTGGTGAAATATVSGGKVTGVTITNPGSGYIFAPTVSFSGGGTGAAATAFVGTATATNVGSETSIPAQLSRNIDAEGNLAWDHSGGAHNGRVYLVYVDRPTTSSNDTDIYTRYSDDDGSTWSSPVRVNDDPPGNGKSQLQPAIAVDQTTGNVAVTWYDARNSGNAGKLVQLFGSASTDGGVTWLRNVQISAGASNSNLDEAAFNFGDYDTMDFSNGVFYRTWADNSNVTWDNPNGAGNDLNVYTARVSLVTNVTVASAVGVGANVNITRDTYSNDESTVAINPTNPLNLFEADTWSQSGNYSMDGGKTWSSSSVPSIYSDTQAVFDQFGNVFLTYINGFIWLAWSTDGGATFPNVYKMPHSDGGDQPSVAVGPSGTGAAGSVWVSYTSPSDQHVAVGIPVTGLGGVDTADAIGPESMAGLGDGGSYGSTAVGPNGEVMVNYEDTGATGTDGVWANLKADGLGPGSFTMPTSPDAGLTSAFVYNGGSGYTSAPTVSFSGGGGSGAQATAVINSLNGTVTAIDITNPGSGYTSYATVNFSGGGGSGAAAFAAAGTITGSNAEACYDLPAAPKRGIDAESNLAWDHGRNHRLYLVYTDRRNTSSTTIDTDIFVRYSDDLGVHWSSPVRVDDDTTDTSQFFPAIAVDQTTGYVAVTWYDTRNDPANNVQAEIYGTISTDGGATWLPNFRIAAGPSDSTTLAANPYPKWQNFGDYDTMDFNHDVFYRTWADNSNSTHDNPGGQYGALDIYTAPVTILPTTFQVTTSTSTPTAGSPVSITVTALDAFGNIDTGYTGTVQFSSSDGGEAVSLPPNYTFTYADNGAHTFTNLVTLVTAGPQTIAATDTANGSLTASASVAVRPGAADHLSFCGQPMNTTAGAPITVKVCVFDRYGNLVTTDSSSVTVAIGTNPVGGTLDGTTTVAVSGGMAMFSNLRITKAGCYTLTAAVGGLTGATSSAFCITPAAADHVGFGVQPSNTLQNTAISPAPTVQVLDQYGNLETTDNSTVTVAIGTNPGSGTLSGTLAVQASGGIATFSNLAIDKPGVGYTLSATDGTLTPGTSASFTITTLPPDHLAFGVQPTNTTAGQAINPAVTVRVLDHLGNLVTTDTSNVTVAIGTNPGGGTLSGTLTVPASGGIATFSTLSINLVGIGTTLTAADGSLTGATSNAFNITPGTPDHLGFGVQPTNTTAGTAISPAVTVQVLDHDGNLVTSDASSVTVGLGSNPGGDTLGGTLTVPASGGIATFSTLSLTKADTGYTLTASDGNLTGATSDTFNITHGPARQLAFGVQPSTTKAGDAISPAVTVQVLDQYGNPVTNDTSNVTVAIGTNAGGGTLSGTLTVPASGGVATFSNLSIDKVGTGYTLSAADGGLTGAISSLFTISHAAAHQLVFGVQPSTTVAGVAISPAVTVQVLDRFGNPVTSDTSNVTVTIGTNAGGGTLSGTTTVAASGGVATFTTLSLDKVGTGYTLTAADGSLTTAVSNPFNVTFSGAHQLAFGVQPSNTTETLTITPAVTVRVLDEFGNLVTSDSSNVTVAIGTNAGGGTLSGTLTVPASGGVATFSNLSIDRPGNGYTLTASDGSLTGATSGTFNITAPGADHLAFGVQPGDTVAGTAIAPAVTVRVLDQFGNLVTTDTSTVTVAIGTNPGGGTLSGTLTVPASGGIATFSTLSIDKAGVGYTLTAADGSLTGATSSAFNITHGPADHLGFGVQPTNTTAGTAISPAVTVQVLDRFGNPVTSDTSNVTVALGANPNGGTLHGTLTVAAHGGVAPFSTLSLDRSGSGYTLTASDANASVAAVESNAFAESAKATRLVVTTPPPASVTSGNPFTLVLAAEDGLGNIDTSYGGPVTLAGLGGATLSGALTENARNGIATFSGLTLGPPGSGYVVEATSGSLTAANTNPITVPPPPPPVILPRGIAAQLVLARVGKKKKLAILVTYADTGETKTQFLSPFQKPAFRAIQVTVADSNGDGVTDQVVLTAKKGKRTATMTFAE
jgi:hypothetical protein